MWFRIFFFFFFQAEDGIRDSSVTGVQTCALPISLDRLVLQQRGLDIGEERRGLERAQAAAPEALTGAAEDQPVLGPRHADIEQAPLFPHGRLVSRAPVQRR